jgi:hypothetical protein
LRDLTLARFAAGSKDEETVIALARRSRSGEDPAHPPRWLTVLLEKLLAEGQADRAYRLWLEFAKLPAAVSREGVYDGGFAGAPGAPPFNWEFISNAEGVAERIRGSLQVAYYGRAPAVLASEVLMLRPGGYRLLLRAEGAATGSGTHLAWTIKCSKGAASLLELPLVDVSAAPKQLTGRFTVPAGCPAQWLLLQGIPGDLPTAQEATIRDVQVVPTAAP